MYVAGVHPYADRLFADATTNPVAFASFDETLHPGGGRYVYRVRKANAAGRTSQRGAIAKVVVRVPSLMPSAPPRREPRVAGDALALLRLAIPRDTRVRAILVFERLMREDTPLAGVQLVRLRNRGDLAATDIMRLRFADGELIAPRSIEFDDAVSDASFLRARLTLAGGPARRVAVWACSVTEDGIASQLAGPWLIRLSSA